MNSELISDFVSLSRYAGERFDLIQAGGGNSSVKLNDGTMLIKASGFLLSDLTLESGYSTVKTKEIANILDNEDVISSTDKHEQERVVSDLIKDSTLTPQFKPSIELTLHSIMHTHTLHTHPVVVNMVVGRKDWKDVLASIFTDDSYATVDYKTPGIELALELKGQIKTFSNKPKIVFLQNHGLIVSSDDASEVRSLTEYVLSRIEKYLNVDFEKYKLVSKLSSYLHTVFDDYLCSYLSDDAVLKKALKYSKEDFLEPPFCPDSLVFCGMQCFEVDDFNNVNLLQNYKDEYRDFPKVILYKEHLMLVARNVTKAKQIEDVLKSNIMILEAAGRNNVNYLEKSELHYLANWDAEKYRQKL